MKIRAVGQLLKDSGVKFWDDNGPRLGAALAYYTALSLSPLLLAAVGIIGLIYGQDAARGEIVEQIRGVVGQEAATVIEQLVAGTTGFGGTAAAFAFVVILFGATGVFTELQSALNAIWKVPGRKVEGGIVVMLRERLLSFLLVWATILLLLASLIVSSMLSGLNARIVAWWPGMGMSIQVANFALTFLIITVLFAMIFKWLPETRLAWSDVWAGAAFTAALFSVGKYLIGLYLGTAAVGSAYGAAGAFVVLLVWIYYSTQILLLGAEVTFVYATKHGRSFAAPAK